ncbi:hypothetical protein PM082_016562 [Marasmius tenuissimus]|nr:hypothetical protein PM082_016562 [Marasmius tenuissimus]
MINIPSTLLFTSSTTAVPNSSRAFLDSRCIFVALDWSTPVRFSRSWYVLHPFSLFGVNLANGASSKHQRSIFEGQHVQIEAEPQTTIHICGTYDLHTRCRYYKYTIRDSAHSSRSSRVTSTSENEDCWGLRALERSRSDSLAAILSKIPDQNEWNGRLTDFVASVNRTGLFQLVSSQRVRTNVNDLPPSFGPSDVKMSGSVLSCSSINA